MLMADTMAIFLVILGLLLAFPALWLLCSGLWAEAVNRAQTTADQGCGKPFLIGLPLTIVAVIVVAVLNNLPGAFGKISAILVACAFALFANTGLAGLVASVGRKLSQGENELPGWKATLRGGAVLALTYLLPVLGWFVILPASMVMGGGLAVMTLFRREAKAANPQLSATIIESLAAKSEYSSH